MHESGGAVSILKSFSTLLAYEGKRATIFGPKILTPEYPLSNAISHILLTLGFFLSINSVFVLNFDVSIISTSLFFY